MKVDYKDNMFYALGRNVGNLVSLLYFSGYDACLNPYHICLMVFTLLKRALTFFHMNILMLSYCHTCKPHVVAFDKLLYALTAYNLKSRVLKFVVEAPYAPVIKRP